MVGSHPFRTIFSRFLSNEIRPVFVSIPVLFALYVGPAVVAAELLGILIVRGVSGKRFPFGHLL